MNKEQILEELGKLFLRWNKPSKPYYSITPQAQRAIIRLVKKYG